jgi:hypothetical protein
MGEGDNVAMVLPGSIESQSGIASADDTANDPK